MKVNISYLVKLGRDREHWSNLGAPQKVAKRKGNGSPSGIEIQVGEM